MRTAIAAFSVALLSFTFAVPPVQAAPIEVNVRIEGRSETLFEGPILTEGHNVKAVSDTKAPAAGRRCNGLNNGQNPTPGATPTAASVDAMSILGEDFDGQWYAEPFEDYFVKRWGPDAQDEGDGEYWGLLVNNVFTDLGGCQYQVDGGDEVLWLYDAFKGRPRLALYPADYSGGARLLTVTAEPGVPFEVEVDAWQGYSEGDPPAAPERTGSSLLKGATVAPTVTGSGGFEAVNAGDPAAVKTGDDGKATIVFDDPGWHRIKATVLGPGGAESAVRSNRLDVCVPEPPADDCGTPPADDQVRVPPPVDFEEEPAEPEQPGTGVPGTGTEGAAAAGGSGAAQPDSAQVRLQLPRIDRSRVAQGMVRVSWRVLDPGVGVRRWTISSRALGRKGARYVTRARGTTATSALLRLPPGPHQLRLTVIDALGRSSTATIGKVEVPG
jgi:Domain of unknown function (DUF4430)